MTQSPTKLSQATGISVPYASQILRGQRTPSLRTALLLYDKLGLKFGPIEAATDEEIALLRRIAA